MIEGLGGALVVTADHGNADCMFEIDKKTDKPKLGPDGFSRKKTSHTLNAVPLHVFAPGHDLRLRDPGRTSPGLANLAATVLGLMGFEAPEDFEASLLASESS